MSRAPDPRRTPYKSDIAAEHLRGRVEADQFVPGKLHAITEPLVDVLSDRIGGARDTQGFYGERFMVYQVQDQWAWGQLQTDGYVGWINRAALIESDTTAPTHRVSALLSRATDASIKVLGHGPLPMGSQVRITDPDIRVGGSSAPFVQCDAGALPASHVKPLNHKVDDWVAVAETFIGTPYVWGGRSAMGIDCSALVQLALQQGGMACPRDSDMQEEDMGAPVDRGDLRRGDLVFWPGHVGIMADEQVLLHANAFAMATVLEPLHDVEARAGEARTIKRV